MISIVTAYYNRKALFEKTLQSIDRQIKEFGLLIEVIAVDDGSKEEERLEDLVVKYPFLKIIYLDPKNKWYKNSCIPFNKGFKEAKGDKIIIQNPECYHFNNILEYTKNNLTENVYLSFGCYSLGKEETNRLDFLVKEKSILNVISENNHSVKMDGLNGWYNHSIHRPLAYHFCCAISRKDLIDLGGFDERYALGVGEDDIELVHRIKLKGTKIKFIDDCIVLHQNHYNIDYSDLNKIFEEKKNIYEHNRNIFFNVTNYLNVWRVGYLEGQEVIRTEEDKLVMEYEKLLNKKIKIIAKKRIARKITLIILNYISKFWGNSY